MYLAEGSSASLELSEVAMTSDQLVLDGGWNEESSQKWLMVSGVFKIFQVSLSICMDESMT